MGCSVISIKLNFIVIKVPCSLPIFGQFGYFDFDSLILVSYNDCTCVNICWFLLFNSFCFLYLNPVVRCAVVFLVDGSVYYIKYLSMFCLVFFSLLLTLNFIWYEIKIVNLIFVSFVWFVYPFVRQVLNDTISLIVVFRIYFLIIWFFKYTFNLLYSYISRGKSCFPDLFSCGFFF